jgi:transcriptional regulator GlxA family with amidase domain
LARIVRARCLLETTTLSIDEVAAAAGFGSSVTFRERFREIVGVSPFDYRKTFRGDLTRTSGALDRARTDSRGST